MSRLVCFVILLSGSASTAMALSIRESGSESTTPFELNIPQAPSSIGLALQVDNDATSQLTVLAWQLELELLPLEGAIGTLSFLAIDAPPSPLFVQEADPMSIPELPPPTPNILVSDADMTEPFEGEQVFPSTARNILQLTIAADLGGSGAFQLIMRNFDPDTFEGSSWIDAQSGLPTAFDNDSESAKAGHQLLGTINVGKLPGDYNGDGFVTSADYDNWRSDFGISVAAPGDGADGNANGVIDASDYVIWRAHLADLTASGSGVSSTVPEPDPRLLIVTCLFGAFGAARQKD
jgi:hypothetical protein